MGVKHDGADWLVFTTTGLLQQEVTRTEAPLGYDARFDRSHSGLSNVYSESHSIKIRNTDANDITDTIRIVAPYAVQTTRDGRA